MSRSSIQWFLNYYTSFCLSAAVVRWYRCGLLTVYLYVQFMCLSYNIFIMWPVTLQYVNRMNSDFCPKVTMKITQTWRETFSKWPPDLPQAPGVPPPERCCRCTLPLRGRLHRLRPLTGPGSAQCSFSCSVHVSTSQSVSQPAAPPTSTLPPTPHYQPWTLTTSTLDLLSQ